MSTYFSLKFKKFSLVNDYKALQIGQRETTWFVDQKTVVVYFLL